MTKAREQLLAERDAIDAELSRMDAEPDPLTREMVRDALRDALEPTNTPIDYGDFGFSETHNYRRNIEAVVDRLLAALRRGMELGREAALPLAPRVTMGEG